MYLDINLTNLTKGVLYELNSTRELLLPFAQIELTHIRHVTDNVMVVSLVYQSVLCIQCQISVSVSVRISDAQGDCATGLNTGCTSDVQVSAKHNTQIPGPAIYTENPDSHLTQT